VITPDLAISLGRLVLSPTGHNAASGDNTRSGVITQRLAITPSQQ
jgi:hypothetical protein